MGQRSHLQPPKAVLAQGGGRLNPNDAINEVLNDNDFVHLSGKYSVVFDTCSIAR